MSIIRVKNLTDGRAPLNSALGFLGPKECKDFPASMVRTDAARKVLDKLKARGIIEWELLDVSPSAASELSSDGSKFVSMKELSSIAGGSVGISHQGKPLGAFFQLDFRGPTIRVTPVSDTKVDLSLVPNLLIDEESSVLAQDGNIFFMTEDRERLRIHPDGAVAINADAPKATFEVKGLEKRPVLDVQTASGTSVLRITDSGALLLEAGLYGVCHVCSVPRRADVQDFFRYVQSAPPDHEPGSA